MILGRWAWSSDGSNHDLYIVFNEDYTCELYERDSGEV